MVPRAIKLRTRMHSSMMRTVRSSSRLSACWDTDPPRTRHPPKNRLPLGPGTTQDQAHPLGQGTPPVDRHTPVKT